MRQMLRREKSAAQRAAQCEPDGKALMSMRRLADHRARLA
jgi:hypothetical protein